MSPTQPATAEPKMHVRAPFIEQVEPSPIKTAERVEPVSMGRFQIHNARPLKGTEPDADGKCFYLLKCYEIGEEALPRDILAHEFDSDRYEPTYILYHGHIRSEKGEPGIVVGYVYDCFGDPKLSHSAFNSSQPTMTRGAITMMPRLKFAVDFKNPRSRYAPLKPEYGPHEGIVAGIDEHIRINEMVRRMRHPVTPPRSRRLRCIS